MAEGDRDLSYKPCFYRSPDGAYSDGELVAGVSRMVTENGFRLACRRFDGVYPMQPCCTAGGGP